MQYLLFIHILAGSISLMAVALAVVSSKGKKLHILSGRTYFWGMAVIFLTAIPMSIASNNIFSFLIAIFSFYLAYAGMKFAKNRTGTANLFDWVAVGLMVFSGLAMWFLALVYFMNNNSQYITLTVFGFIAIRWYSLAYIFGIIIGWWYGKKIIIKKNEELNQKINLSDFDDLITYIIIAIILGGRLGYVVFYNFEYFIQNPFEILKVWKGGMSFHGALIGIILATIIFSAKRKIKTLFFLDIIHSCCNQ